MIAPTYEIKQDRLYAPRYSLFEVDGSIVEGGLYHQKPAALKAARQRGFGLYDHREEKVLLALSVPERLDRLRGTETRLWEELNAVGAKLVVAREEAKK